MKTWRIPSLEALRGIVSMSSARACPVSLGTAADAPVLIAGAGRGGADVNQSNSDGGPAEGR